MTSDHYRADPRPIAKPGGADIRRSKPRGGCSRKLCDTAIGGRHKSEYVHGVVAGPEVVGVR